MSWPSSLSIDTSRFCEVFLYCLFCGVGSIISMTKSPTTEMFCCCVWIVLWNGLVIVV